MWERGELIRLNRFSLTPLKQDLLTILLHLFPGIFKELRDDMSAMDSGAIREVDLPTLYIGIPGLDVLPRIRPVIFVLPIRHIGIPGLDVLSRIRRKVRGSLQVDHVLIDFLQVFLECGQLPTTTVASQRPSFVVGVG